MVSRAMAQDKSISPKAKGVLLYLLSLPSDWQIYHSQLQKALDIGEDYLNSAFDELLKAGYAERFREKVKGVYQPYRYKIREFKKLVPNGENPPGKPAHEETPPQGSFNQTGLASPENPGIQSNDPTKKTATATNNPVAAAVLFVLETIDIPQSDKIEICKKYDIETIRHAIAWATHPLTNLTKGLAPAIKWACKEKPPMPKVPEPRKSAVAAGLSDQDIQDNRDLVTKTKTERWGNLNFRRKVTDHVEYVSIGNDKLYYKDPKFKELFAHYLNKLGL